MRRLLGFVGKLARRTAALAVLGTAARVDVWNMMTDLMEAGLDMGTALRVTIGACRDQGQGGRAWVLQKWSDALRESRFQEEIARWVPASEAMLLQAEGRVDATGLFAAAARISEARAEQSAAVWSALGMPLVLVVGILTSLWLSGLLFVPAMLGVAPRERWDLPAQLFGDASLWVYENDVWIVVWSLVGAVILALLTLNWTGRGRVLADRVAPFSLYRTIAGSAFLFVVIEFLGAGVDLNDRTFARLKAASSRYTRSRIEAIETRMRAGRGMGRAMVECGQGFPDPSLVGVVAALETNQGWEAKLAGFVARWSTRAKRILRQRTALLSGVLMALAALLVAIAVLGMFGMMKAADTGFV
ncbi:MAG: hypothetical protein OYH76_19905 [Defluviicoccus sp.]|nr:hypothetical protein [Defluviicoccus sp.]MDE0278167.1 hypothetical protein [Defluviicoccus sp.]